MDDFDDIFKPLPKPQINNIDHPAVAELIEERNRSIPIPGQKIAIVEGSSHKRAIIEAIMNHIPNDPGPMIDSDEVINPPSIEINIETRGSESESTDPFKDIRPLFQMGDYIDIDENWYRGRKLFITDIDHKSGIVMEDEMENEKGNKWANMKICFPWEATRYYILKGTMKVRK